MDSVPFSVDSSSSSSYHSVHDINDKTMTDAVSKPRPVASGRAGKKRARRRRWSRKPRRTQKVPTVMVNPRFKDVGCQYKQDELVQSNNKWQLEISKHNGSNLYQDDDNFSTREFLCTCNDIIKVVDSNERTTPIICEALLGSANIRCNSVADCSEMKQITHSKTAFLCKEHSVLLKNHRCCPICGIFCQSRDFIHCSREKSHRFHLGCVMNTKCDLKCPHCGEDCKIGLGFNEQKLLSENALDTNTNDTNSTTSSGFCETISGSVCESNSNLSQSVFDECFPNKFKFNKRRGKPYRLSLQLKKKIFDAAASGDAVSLKNLLEMGYYPNCKNNAQTTPMHVAAKAGHLLCLRLLLSFGGDVNAVDTHLRTPLYLACHDNHLDCVQYLYMMQANANLKDQSSCSCLHIAANNGNHEIVAFLLENNCVSVDEIDNGGWTAIVWAADNGYVDTVRLLLKFNASVAMKDYEGNICLHWCAMNGSAMITSIVLNAYRSAVNLQNTFGDTPLHIAARQGNLACVEVLLAAGSDQTITNFRNLKPYECTRKGSEVYKALYINHCSSVVLIGTGRKILSADISRGRERLPIRCINEIDDCPLPDDYLYVIENCETSYQRLSRSIKLLQSCNCKDDCANNGVCSCGSRTSKEMIAYTNEGRMKTELLFSGSPVIYECNKQCSCWMNCRNRVIQHGIRIPLEVFRTKRKGWGVKTMVNVPAGTFVCEYIGEIISDGEAEKRTDDDNYIFDLDVKGRTETDLKCIDARKYGNVGRFINHSCHPNLVPVRVFIDYQDRRFPRFAFFSLRELDANEELSFDYGKRFWSLKCKEFRCCCDEANCHYY